MKSKVLIAFILLIDSVCFGQIGQLRQMDIVLADNLVSADSIVLFKFNSDNFCNQSKAVSILKDNEISTCFDLVKIVKGSGVERIISLLHDEKTYGGGNAACFDTDYGIIAIKDNTIIAYANISLSCNKLIARPRIQEQESHYQGQGVGSTGFSSSGRALLISLLGIDQ